LTGACGANLLRGASNAASPGLSLALCSTAFCGCSHDWSKFEPRAEAGSTASGADYSVSCGSLKDMVPFRTAHGAPFCIDKTEVSVARYDAWRGVTTTCADGKTGLAPPKLGEPPMTQAASMPVRAIPWCGAKEFCSGGSKRLCTHEEW
jgi:formylglycine-generating enzyme required for sulfatase activity